LEPTFTWKCATTNYYLIIIYMTTGWGGMLQESSLILKYALKEYNFIYELQEGMLL